MVRQFLSFFALLLVCIPSLKAQWVQTGGPCTGAFLSSATADGVLLVGTFDGLYRSTDDGHTWHLEHAVLKDSVVLALAVQHRDGNPSYIFAGTGSGIFRSNDEGMTWTAVNNGLSSKSRVVGLATNPQFVFSSIGGALYRSSNSGASWTPLTGASGTVLSTTDSELFVGSSTALFRSTDNGATWTNVTGALRGGVNEVVRQGNVLIAGSWFGVFRSLDNGQKWSLCSLKDTSANAVLRVEMKDQSVLVACSLNSITRSLDNGDTWESWRSHSYVSVLFASGTTIFAGMSGDIAGVLRSDDEGATWLGSSNGLANQMASTVLAVGSTLLAGLGGDGLRISTDRGGSWQMPDSSFPVRSYVRAFARSYGAKPRVYVATSADVYASTDTGQHWKRLTDSSATLRDIRSIAATDRAILFGTSSHGLYYTIDDGAQWQQVVLPPSIFAGAISALAAVDSDVYLGIVSGSSNWLYHAIARYTPGDWRAVDTPYNAKVRGIYIDPDIPDHRRIFAPVGNGVLRSTDKGVTWTLQRDGLTNVNCQSVEGARGRIFASSYYGDVCVSEDGGDHWRATNAPFTRTAGYALSASDGYLYAGTGNAGVWRYSLDSPLSVSTVHSYAATPKVTFRDGRLQVSSSEDVVDRVDIYSMTGALVQRLDYARTQSVAALPPGLYEAVVYSSGRKLAACRFFIR